MSEHFLAQSFVPKALEPELLLRAYAAGIFPMGDSRESDFIFWLNPEWRTILPLDARFHVPASLQKCIRKTAMEVRVNTAFEETLRGCIERSGASDEPAQSTWINPAIHKAVLELYELGFAHSVECWENKRLVGGLYGVALGGAFFGESMFSHRPNASKLALIGLVALLRRWRMALLDTQYQTPHLARFGAEEIPRTAYMQVLGQALRRTRESFAPRPQSLSKEWLLGVRARAEADSTRLSEGPDPAPSPGRKNEQARTPSARVARVELRQASFLTGPETNRETNRENEFISW